VRLALALVLQLLAVGRPDTADLAFRAFDLAGEAAVVGLPRSAAEAALAEAVAEALAIESLADPGGTMPGGLGRLNAAAGSAAVPVDARLAELLARALSFCTWSRGVNGPAGGPLYQLWGGRARGTPEPDPAALTAAASLCGCERLRVDAKKGTAELAAGSAADLAGFAPGFAVDRAIEVLRRRGATSARVRLGGVERGIGPGPDGHGWPAQLSATGGLEPPLAAVSLRDQALAVAARTDPQPHLDLSTGRAAQGVLAVLAASELAVDAQGLAGTLFATGSRRGQLRLGGLSPRPSVLWLVGSGEGSPLLVDYRWSALR